VKSVGAAWKKVWQTVGVVICMPVIDLKAFLKVCRMHVLRWIIYVYNHFPDNQNKKTWKLAATRVQNYESMVKE
jgi:hypothetical protein